LNNKSAECHFNLASAYEEFGNIENAIIHFTETANLDQDNVDCLMKLSKLLEKVENWKDAYKYYKKAFHINSKLQKAIDGIKRTK
jgi:tetratricopeptide (TPR) repeat protein